MEIESLLTATAEKVDIIFNKLLVSNENIIDWVQFYQKSYIIASLNLNISKISHNDWHAASNSTNYVEAAHATSNREEKQLKLMTAILREQRLDMQYFKRIKIKNNYNIDLSGHDKS
ncbi:7480_t:CDS:2, partial [Racocetra persica]